ncbi:hypothetical protein M3Y97_00843300 [Aphelenchoides bicaudatus]|nr:hypothetical protein M3Y97_00843300 [Aphelenchoides bicaudatus]
MGLSFITLSLLAITLVYHTTQAQNIKPSSIKCDLPENINQLPERNYVPGDDCKQELVITDDILAVLDMLDKDLERHTTKTGEKLGTNLRADQAITDFPIQHETLIPTRAIETGLNINNTLPSLQLQTEVTTILPPIIASDTTQKIANTASNEEEIDYSDFITTSASNVEPSKYTVSQKAHPKSVESSEQPFAFTGSPSVTFSPDFTPTTRLVHDYAEPRDTETVTSRAVRIMKVRIPTDYEDFEKQKYPNGYAEHKNNFKPRKDRKGLAQRQVMNDPDVVSEQRRQEEIHLLAVSYLNSKQLTAFNSWSSQRRKRIKAREQMLYPLSFKAREALKHLALTPDDEERRSTAQELPGELRDELKAFAIRLREQHQPAEQIADEYRRRNA